jgi:hypothetical protein
MTLRHDDTLTISDFRGDGNLPRAYADFVLRESGLRLEEHTDEFQIKVEPIIPTVVVTITVSNG